MFVSTTRTQLKRATTTEERARMEPVYDGLAKAPGFRALYGIRPSEMETVEVAVFDSQADFQKAYERAARAIQTIIGPIVVVMSQRDSGEAVAQYVHPDTTPGFLSIRCAPLKNAVPSADRALSGKRFADAVAKAPEGRHAFIEFWPSDTELIHLGVYDSRDSRTRFMQQLRSVVQGQAPTAVESAGPVRETTGDVAVYRIK